MATRTTFIQKRGIYPPVERIALQNHAKSPFGIFKDDENRWSIGHLRSGLVINALIPPKLARSKARLLLFIAEMETALPEACAMVGLIESEKWPEELKPYGREMIDWAANYRDPGL